MKEQHKRTTSRSAAFKRIMQKVMNPETLVHLYFIQSVSPLFQGFLKLFQAEAPQVHILYEMLNELVKKILPRFTKPEIVESTELSCMNHKDVNTHGHLYTSPSPRD